MTSLHPVTGRQRRIFVPHPAVPDRSVASQDPPIYRDLLRAWADRGRTLPGRQDPEWVRLAAPTVRTGQFGADRFSGLRVPPRDGR
ncbi:hypothetical protein ACFYMX_29585 [Streptomyces griseofuscus]|uniref:hypothetical protein n=1 Tax=Streptomyces TaxID=1883 RepID=UPI00081D3652|nr:MULTISPECIES: hypothetical protein [unclassified Streptomyces]MBJ6999922.1 hypothetical protein [Streptomyces sp. CRPSP2-6A1]MYQ93496.1 hypothetical protein [Streptomyces sp. SID4946]SCF82397.1 hypothetical protein GA0115256_121621 [Streptomyces sp. DconLS]SCG02491.1 hypothetical protein GA0115258_12585 [Streptomyces sp. LamerLS-31b]